jgi:hypothetical protein
LFPRQAASLIEMVEFLQEIMRLSSRLCEHVVRLHIGMRVLAAIFVCIRKLKIDLCYKNCPFLYF